MKENIYAVTAVVTKRLSFISMFDTNLFSKPGSIKYQNIIFPKIEIKGRLVIHTENKIRPTYNFIIFCVFEHQRYHTDEANLKRFNSFSEKSSTTVTSNYLT